MDGSGFEEFKSELAVSHDVSGKSANAANKKWKLINTSIMLAAHLNHRTLSSNRG